MTRAISSSVASLLLLLLVGCGGASPAPPAAAPTPTLEAGSPEARGAGLFVGAGRCSSCHALAPDTVIVGPSLAGIATHAGERVAGLDARDYLEESILDPDAYRPPGFEDRQMDTTLARSLTVDQVDAIVAYLLTLE